MATSFFGARPLYSWWQRQQRLPRQAITLGVTGLPEGVGRLPQGAPALLLTQDEASTQCWTPLLLQALLAGGPVLVLAACAKDADALWQYPALRQAYDAGRLRVALFPPEKQQCLRHDGLQHWASEVRRASRGRASVCVLDARALFAGATQAELRRLGGQLRRFASQQVWPVALMLPLARATDGTWFMEGTQIAAAARSASLGMGHVATLALEAAQPVLSLHSWDGGEQGALFHMRYDLHQQDGALVYAGSCAHGEVPVLVQAPDAEVVYTTSACVPASVIVPDNWVVLPDLPALEQAAQQAVGATLVLDVGDPPRFDELCALVHRLRSKRPASLKIIVRETTAKLRAHSEQALLHLGVTAVAYRELGFARLLRLIASCRTLVHTQQPQEDLAQALAAFVPATVRGYQSPATFERISREMLERGSSVGFHPCPGAPAAVATDCPSGCPQGLPCPARWRYGHGRRARHSGVPVCLHGSGCSAGPEQYVHRAHRAVVCRASGGQLHAGHHRHAAATASAGRQAAGLHPGIAAPGQCRGAGQAPPAQPAGQRACSPPQGRASIGSCAER